ncbi:intracellular protein transport protein USO1-like [Nicotiana tomentosiformis]|uniref:intracellular protein transport protein USO1-like n=1 Tax=Nicotiana tomentosiformis TaxID=4098 RepID=UPI00388CBEAA
MLTTDYELFRMKDDESIQDMHTRFTSIINELHSLGETIPRNKLVRKILSVLPSSWESKVNAITKSKDLQTLTIDELVGNLKTYEMKKKKDNERREPKREKNLVLKTDNNDLGGEDGDMAYLTRRFQKMSDDDEDEINFLDLQRNLKSYSPKKLMSLANETIKNPKKEKNALDEKIANIEHERDDLIVVVADLKETFKCVRKKKEALAERVANIEHERDDLLVVVVDLKEIIGELKMESRPENSQKGKEVASEAYIKLESDLNSVKSSMCAELEKNKQLQEELGRVKSDIEKSLKWTWSSDAITVMYTNNGENRQGIWGTVKGSNLQWYMDSGCSKHMTRSTNDFISLKALQGGSVSFENGKKGYVLGVGRIGKSLSYSIKNVYYVKVLKYSLLSIFQIYDKGNKNGNLRCLSVVDDDAELWHRRLGHASFTLLNKLVRKDLVRGLPKSSFKDHKVCDACVKGKQARSSLKPKKGSQYLKAT